MDKQLTIGNRALTLRFSLRAFATLQDHFQCASVTEVAARLQNADGLSVEDLVAIMYAGTRSHHPDLSKDELYALLDEVGLDAVSDAIEAGHAAGAPPANGDGRPFETPMEGRK